MCNESHGVMATRTACKHKQYLGCNVSKMRRIHTVSLPEAPDSAAPAGKTGYSKQKGITTTSKCTRESSGAADILADPKPDKAPAKTHLNA